MPTSVPPNSAPDPAVVPSPDRYAPLKVGELRHRWGWFVALGIALVFLGAIAFGNMLLATVASVYMVGVLMLLGAVGQIVHAFSVKSWSSFIWWMIGGVIYAIAGIAAFINPLFASAAITLFLAIALAATGATRIWVAIQMRPQTGWGWVLVSGIVTLLAGIIIAIGWPVNSLWVLGMFLAIDLLFQGWASIALGLALRKQ